MSVKTILAECGMTAEQVEQAVMKYGEQIKEKYSPVVFPVKKPCAVYSKPIDDEDYSIYDDRPKGGATDFALHEDLRYKGYYEG